MQMLTRFNIEQHVPYYFSFFGLSNIEVYLKMDTLEGVSSVANFITAYEESQ